MSENAKKPESIKVAPPRVVVTADTPAYYANYIEVSNSQYDFSLSVARIPSPLPSEQIERIQKGEPFLVDALLQVVLPPIVAEGLVKALTEQLQRYKEMVRNQGGQIGGN